MPKYKEFDLVSPSIPGQEISATRPPWGAKEFLNWKDLIDTVLGDAIVQKKSTEHGHRHYRLYDSATGSIEIVCSTNNVKLSSLAGEGIRNVVADSEGNLDTADLSDDVQALIDAAVNGTSSYYSKFSADHIVGNGNIRDVGGMTGIGDVGDVSKILFPLTVRRSEEEASICVSGPDDQQQAYWLFNETNIRWGIYRKAGSTDLCIGVATDEDKITMKSDGKFGIKKSPGHMLDVNGDINISSGFHYKVNGNPLSISDIDTSLINYSNDAVVGGFSANVEKYIYYKKQGNTIHLWFTVSGTSNSEVITLSLPFAASLDYLSIYWRTPCLVMDNSNEQEAPGFAFFQPGLNALTFCKSYASNNFTTSGGKKAEGYLCYEA